MLWLILLVVSVIFVYVKLIKPHYFWKEKNIPHLKPVPLFGNLWRIIFRRASFVEGLQDIAKNFPNERYFGLYEFNQPALVIQDTELIKQIGIKKFEHFLDHRGIISEKLDPLFSKNLFSLKGLKWRKMRSTLSPAFTSSKMKNMFILMSECAEQFTAYFLKQIEGRDGHITVEMKDIFTRFANDVIASCAFGIQTDSLKDRENIFYKNGIRATNFNGIKGLKFFGYSFSPFLMELFKVRLFDLDISDFFRQIVVGNIRTREEKGIYRPDMIHLLMEARKGKLKYEETVKSKEEDTGFATVEESDVGKQENLQMSSLTDDDLTAQALIFFFAGFDGTSTLMSHVANELALNPDIQEKLQEEIDDAMENCNGKITYEAVTKMKYLDMVVCETLRKWPLAQIIDRQCTKEFTIEPILPHEKPVVLNVGDHVWFLPFNLHRDPNYFPNPDKFDPERFSDENKDKINPMTYIPFGVGPRNCIGSRFALLETKIVFIHLLSKFNLVVDKKTQIPFKLSKSNINLIPDNGFWLGLEPRKKY